MDWTRSIDPEGLHMWVVRGHEEEVRRAELIRIATNDRATTWRARAVQLLWPSRPPVGRTARSDP